MNKNKEILNVINSLPVFEQDGGDMPYILVENNPKNISKLESVGISKETAEKYGDNEYFCILALAFSEGYAEEFVDGKFV